MTCLMKATFQKKKVLPQKISEGPLVDTEEIANHLVSVLSPNPMLIVQYLS